MTALQLEACGLQITIRQNMLTTLAINNYRSALAMVLPLGPLNKKPDCHGVKLTQELGETQVVGQGWLSTSRWHWSQFH